MEKQRNCREEPRINDSGYRNLSYEERLKRCALNNTEKKGAEEIYSRPINATGREGIITAGATDSKVNNLPRVHPASVYTGMKRNMLQNNEAFRRPNN